MTVVLDTNVVVALYDAADPDHRLVADWIATLDEDLVATPLAVAEMDYLVAERGGAAAREALWTRSRRRRLRSSAGGPTRSTRPC